jgi:hypothetical protein
MCEPAVEPASPKPAPNKRPNAGQIRQQAKDLKQEVVAGDAGTLERVRRSHPNGATSVRTFTLRDAQIVLARESGFRSWRALIDSLAPEQALDPSRWAGGPWSHWQRVVDCARRRGLSTIHPWHVVEALITVDRSTVASRALLAAGLRRDRLELFAPADPSTDGSVTSTPAQQMIFARAEGLALAEGASKVTDEHLLLAMLFAGDGSDIAHLGIKLDVAYEYLCEHGVRVPVLRPAPQPRIARFVKRIYVRDTASREFRVTLSRFHVSRDRRFGMNISSARPGWRWYDAGATIDLEAIAHATLDDADWEIMTSKQGVELELSAGRIRTAHSVRDTQR